MTQQQLRKLLKTISNIEQRLVDIENVLRDVSMKVCHLIKRRNHYAVSE